MKKLKVAAVLLLVAFVGYQVISSMNGEIEQAKEIDKAESKFELLCKNAGDPAFFEEFTKQLEVHGNRIEGSANLEDWTLFYMWVERLKPCTDGAYAEGIASAWENAVAHNFRGFLNFYRKHPELKRDLDFEFERVYHADPDGMVSVQSQEMLHKGLGGKCPPEFEKLCAKYKK